MTVKIEIYGEAAVDALRELRALSAGLLDGAESRVVGKRPELAMPYGSGEQIGFASATDGETGLPEVAKVPAGKPMRERGKPAPGRARRTKEEIAEDEAADKADAGAAAARGNISTAPEDRVDPGQVDSPEVEAQDKADEQAEVEANRDQAKPLTREDLRAAVGKLVNVIGVAEASAQIVGIIGCKQTEVPDTQEAIAEAIRKVEAHVAKIGRGSEAPATKEELVKYMRAYESKFGEMHIREDGAAIFIDALGAPPEGEPFWRLSIVVEQGPAALARAIALWKAAAEAPARYKAGA